MGGGESCIFVADSCGPFGRAMRNTVSLVMESTLAKLPKLALPDFSMLTDREQMCQWLRKTIAMQPLRDVTLQKVVNASQLHSRYSLSYSNRRLEMLEMYTDSTAGNYSFEPSTRLLQAPVPFKAAPPYPSRPRATLDPVRDGQQSGFFYNARRLRDQGSP